MSISICFKWTDWMLVSDIFYGQSATEFKWYPQLYWNREHIGIHWLGCCCCLER